MKILGARVLVEECDSLDYSDLIKVSSNGEEYYFIRDLGTGDFNPLCERDIGNANKRLKNARAENYTSRDPTLEKGFREAVELRDGKVIRFHLEGFLETLKTKGRFGEEE
jgi:hypothetical protein